MIDHRNAKGARIFEGGAHQLGAGDRLAVVTDRYRACPDHLTEFGEHFSLLPHRDSPDRVDARGLRPLCLADDEPNRCLIVGHGIGVGHRADCGETACCGRPGTGRNRLDVLATRLAQMTVHVDEPWRNDEAIAIDDLGAIGRVDAATAVRDHAICDQQVADDIQSLRRIDQCPTAQNERLHSRSSRPRLLPPLAASASSGLPPASR